MRNQARKTEGRADGERIWTDHDEEEGGEGEGRGVSRLMLNTALLQVEKDW